MRGHATVEAPANIAFIKYWGAVDLEHAIPVNPSISMTLRECVSRTTVRILEQGAADEVILAQASGKLEPAPEAFGSRVQQHLERLRHWRAAGDGPRPTSAIYSRSSPITGRLAPPERVWGRAGPLGCRTLRHRQSSRPRLRTGRWRG